MQKCFSANSISSMEYVPVLLQTEI